MHYFNDANQLLEWAEADILKIIEAHNKFIKNLKFKKIIEIEANTGNKIYKAIFDEPLSSETKRHCASAINNCRLSLDQALSAVWKMSSLGKDPSNLYYPIRDCLSDLEGKLQNKPYSCFNISILDAIRQMSPYHQNQDGSYGNYALVALSEAARKKHLIIPKVICSISSTAIKNGFISDLITPLGDINLDMQNCEIILGKTGPKGQLIFDLELDFILTTEGAGKLDGTNLLLNMEAILKNCKYAVGKIEYASTGQITKHPMKL